MGCQIAATIDGETADGPDALRETVSRLTSEYQGLGLKPAMSSVLRLR